MLITIENHESSKLKSMATNKSRKMATTLTLPSHARHPHLVQVHILAVLVHLLTKYIIDHHNPI